MTTNRRQSYAWLTVPAQLGHYTLPEELTTAVVAVDRLSAHKIAPAGRTRAQVIGQYESDLLTAAETGEPLPDVPDLAAVEAEEQARTEAHAALRRVVEDAREDLRATVTRVSQVIIRDHLAPAHAEVVAAAAKVAPLLRKVGTDPVAIAQADAATRKAVAAFTPHVERYASIRATWGRLVEMGNILKYPQHLAAYAELRHPGEVWPDYANAQHQVRAKLTPPWQAGDNRARLLWIAEHADAGEVWMPTAAELNDAIEKDNSESMSNLERARWAREAMGALG